ncbi:MAG: UpxY family transcription antiterminator [Candidatus Acidiferrales bacterium]|jgi:transcription antitermination factor NusG
MNQSDLNQPNNWYALQVRTRWEEPAAAQLRGKGFQTLLPTYTTKRRWSDRYKIVQAPLFPGYVFCSFDVHNRLPVLITPGVISVVGRGKTPVPVDEAEMTAIRSMVRSGVQAQPWPYLEIGERVRIKDDVFDGMEGILINFKGKERVVISLTLLRRSVALEIDRAHILAVGSPGKTSSAKLASLPLIEQVAG